MFGLQHSGLYKNGQWHEWSELEQGRIGGWMGGRNSHFLEYEWKRSNIKRKSASYWQDPKAIIRQVAGLANGGSGGGNGSGDGNGGGDGDAGCDEVAPNHSDYCSDTCPCSEGEGDCDSHSQCAGSLVCQQRSGTDHCVQPSSDCHSGRPGSSRYCSESCPCDRGEGDCDSDKESKGSLYCKKRSGTDYCRRKRR